MILALLRELERNPGFELSGFDLRAGWQELTSDEKLQLLTVGAPLQRSIVIDGRQLAVVEHNSGYCAVDEDDPLEKPIELLSTDFRIWKPDVLRIGTLLRDRYGLNGTPELLTSRVLFIGEHSPGVGVVVGFFSSAALAELECRALRTRTSNRYQAIVVVTPSLVIRLAAQAELDGLNIAVVRLVNERLDTYPVLDAAAASLLPGGLLGGFDPDSGLRFAPGFRSITFRGRNFAFGTLQASAIELLFEAHRSGTPDLAEAWLLERIGSKSVTVRDLFKGTDAWEQGLIAPGATKGTHRLVLGDIPS